MKLLFLSPIFPLPIDRGQHARIMNLLRSCATVFQTTVVAPDPGRPDLIRQLSAECHEVRLFPASNRPDRLTNLRWRAEFGLLQSSRNLALLASCRRELKRLRLDDYDLILLERTILSPLVRPFRRKTVLDLDDLEHVKYLQSLRNPTSIATWLRDVLLLGRYLYRDILLSRTFARAIVCSEEDAGYLRGLGSQNVAVIPNGTEAGRQQTGSPRQRGSSPRLVFLGNMDYGPNLDAVEYFSTEMVPLLCARGFPVELDVIGRGHKEGRHFAGRARFVGFVDDLSEAMSQYDIFIAPIRIGSGTKLKILDAMANGLPVVTTSIGARGLGLVHRETALIADTPESFCSSIEEVWKDKRLSESIASSAKMLVEQQFRWPLINRATAEWLRACAEEVRRKGDLSPSDPGA